MSKNTAHVTYREDGTILIKDVRLSYEHIFTPWAKNEVDPESGKPVAKKYSGSFIMPLYTHRADIISLKAHLDAMALENFKAKIPATNFCLRDGNLKAKDEYAKTWYVATSQTAGKTVQVVDRAKKKLTAETNNNLIYSGCWVNVLIRPWVQKNDYGKKINANLLVVQFVRDDDAFGDGIVPDVNDVLDNISGDFPDEIKDIGGDDDLGNLADDDISL